MVLAWDEANRRLNPTDAIEVAVKPKAIHLCKSDVVLLESELNLFQVFKIMNTKLENSKE